MNALQQHTAIQNLRVVSNNVAKKQQHIELRIDGFRRLIRSDNVQYVEAAGNYTYIYLNDGSKHCYSRTLKQTLLRLDAQKFLRTHQSYAVHIASVMTIESRAGASYCVLCDGKRIAISRARKKSVKQWFLRQEEGKNRR